MPYPKLHPDSLPPEGAEFAAARATQQAPLKVLQIGEGNFLRGFFDWMIHVARKQGVYHGSVAVTQPRPSGAHKLRELADQGGLYTLIVRGLQNGERIEQHEIISVFSDFIDPYEEWNRFLGLAAVPSLEVVVSNTTEAGLVYQRDSHDGSACPTTFPARLTRLLYQRFVHFSGAKDKGLVCLPCELVERNGDKLRELVLQHSADWGLSTAFGEWVREDNLFVNSLVDRIVTGFPTSETEQWAERLGYRDTLLNTAEPYYLWAIEGDDRVERVLPFRAAGLNVHFVDSLTSYQLQKVRILNGAHTLMAPMGVWRDLPYVRDVIQDGVLSLHIQRAIHQEIIPTLPLAVADIRRYADTVWERFGNPFIQHRLQDILLNSISKFRVRLLPSVLEHVHQTGLAPALITQSWAELIRVYQVRRLVVGAEVAYVSTTRRGTALTVRDDVAVLEAFHDVWRAFREHQISLLELVEHTLGNATLWGRDLRDVDHLVEEIHAHLQGLEGVH